MTNYMYNANYSCHTSLYTFSQTSKICIKSTEKHLLKLKALTYFLIF